MLAQGPNQTERLLDAQLHAKPLQRELRAVGDIGPAEKPLQQAQTRGEILRVTERRGETTAVLGRPVPLSGGQPPAGGREQPGGRALEPGAEP